MTADEAKQEVLKVYPDAYTGVGDGDIWVMLPDDETPQYLGEGWIDAAERVPTPVPTPASEATERKFVKVLRVSFASNDRYLIEGKIGEVYRSYVEEASAWSGKPEYTMTVVGIKDVPYLVHLKEGDFEPFLPTPPSTEDATATRDCPYCGKRQFFHITLKEWIHSTGSDAYDCKRMVATEESGEPKVIERCRDSHCFVDQTAHCTLKEGHSGDHEELAMLVCWPNRETKPTPATETPDYLRGKLDGFNEGVEAAYDRIKKDGSGSDGAIDFADTLERIELQKRGNS